MNVVCTGDGRFVEVQGTAEAAPFDRDELNPCSTSPSPARPSCATSRRRRWSGPSGVARGGPRLVLATHNPHKVGELREILRPLLPGLHDDDVVGAADLGADPPVEDGVTFAENALLKARALAGATGLPAVADDSGLCVDVLGGAPGVFSARWAGRHGDDRANLSCCSPSWPMSRAAPRRPLLVRGRARHPRRPGGGRGGRHARHPAHRAPRHRRVRLRPDPAPSGRGQVTRRS